MLEIWDFAEVRINLAPVVAPPGLINQATTKFRGVKESFPSRLKKEAAHKMPPSLCSPSPRPSPVEGEGIRVGLVPVFIPM